MPTNLALQFKYARWNIGIGMWNEAVPGFGEPFAIAFEAEDGWELVAIIEGPKTGAQWASVMAAAGGMGNYLYSKLPAIQSALKKYFDQTPDLPPVTNADPYTRDGFNAMLMQYFTLQDVPGEGHPRMVFKPYP